MKKVTRASPLRSPMDAAPRTVLLAVLGESPAILTETAWALAKEKPSVVPNRVRVLTTTQGASRLNRELLSPAPQFAGLTPWQALREEVLGTEAAQSESALVLEPPLAIYSCEPGRSTARELDDVRTRAENEAAADFILEEVRRLAAHPDTRLVASIAGGRKTMGALLYGAMTLLGREIDRVTHVLVEPPFDQHLEPTFFFPRAREKHRLIQRDGHFSEHSATAKTITLADLPFVPLRNAFADLGQEVGDFADLVGRYSKALPQCAAGSLRGSLTESPPGVVINGRVYPLDSADGKLGAQLAILRTLFAVQP